MCPVVGTQIVYVEGPRSAGALSTGKRAFDLVVGTIALILAAPVMAVTALAVKADSGPSRGSSSFSRGIQPGLGYPGWGMKIKIGRAHV